MQLVESETREEELFALSNNWSWIFGFILQLDFSGNLYLRFAPKVSFSEKSFNFCFIFSGIGILANFSRWIFFPEENQGTVWDWFAGWSLLSILSLYTFKVSSLL